MKNQITTNVPRGVMRMALATAAVLMVPFMAMQFTKEVNWTAFDFIIAGTLLFGTGVAYVFSTRNVVDKSRKRLIGGVFLVALVLVWIELAVGIFD